MKLIIDIDEKIYKESKKECEENDSLIIDTFTYAIGNGIPFEFGNLSVEAIEESSHCPACIHYVQGDVPNVFCEKCKNRDELYRRIENDI